jgi:hypothetical protein
MQLNVGHNKMMKDGYIHRGSDLLVSRHDLSLSLCTIVTQNSVPGILPLSMTVNASSVLNCMNCFKNLVSVRIELTTQSG